LQINRKSDTVTLVATAISIKQLHEKTGELVRRAGQSRTPVGITDRGKLIALIVAPKLVPSAKRRRRSLLPEYRKLLRTLHSSDVLDDLEAVRDER
jgi:antitoxin (DNA-binding transcriptional repressor) of toxin-antitoxin stability system